jgi:hypothetical protein
MLFANEVVTDEYNNSYITGYFSSVVDFDPGPAIYNLTSEGGYDVFVAKYSPDGSLVWARRVYRST